MVLTIYLILIYYLYFLYLVLDKINWALQIKDFFIYLEHLEL